MTDHNIKILNHVKTKSPLLKKITVLLSGTIVLALSVLTFIGLLAPDPGDKATPAGYPQNWAQYVVMRDGVKIAVDVWLPPNLEPNQSVPVLMRMTRYWRDNRLAFVGKVQLLLTGQLTIEEIVSPTTIALNNAGYAVVLVDARGSGASEGTRPIEWSPDEIADYGEVVEWITAQPWSNGNIGAWGVSYDGNTAELLTTHNHPAVKAVAPQYSDFDPHLHLARPGGVFNEWLIKNWNDANQILDNNDVCGLAKMADTSCLRTRVLFTAGVKSVDNDRFSRQLRAAVAQHDSADVYTAVQTLTYRDSNFADTSFTLGEISPYQARTAIEQSATPMYVWVSWLDAGTVEGALSRYLTFSNPQQLIIGAWSHGGEHNADPYLPPDTPPNPPAEEQLQMLIDFFDRHLKSEDAPPLESSIRYYTLGEGVWKTTETWPPLNFLPQRWYFDSNNTLTLTPPTSEAGTDTYTVDFTASSGENTRWHTQLSSGNIIYPDRASEDKKLLTYTSTPLENDTEITGSPVITLYVASTESDGAFHVYLEDVAPDGRVTYITEGILRALHHPISEASPPYVQLGPYHSYQQADAKPLTPGQITKISFSLYPTSALIQEGHRIRVAIAGHDASVFARYPTEGTPILTMHRNQQFASQIELPMQVRP